ncbi:MAG TPA: SGNH/GDSL hydrolase family protein [Prolixibacteraceae bacterium]|nr:SGNH/GDSL hydrolase family protein [Prolixibacteraceae bacterium]
MAYQPNTCSNSLKGFKHSFTAIIAFVLLLCFLSLTGFAKSTKKETWVGTWSTAPQLVEPNNMPPAPGLSNNTLRQVVKVSIGGKELRVRFSNEFSKSPVTMNLVHVAVSAGGGSINGSTIQELKFDGKTEVTMSPGVAITSDPISFNLEPRMELAITIFFGQTSPDVTGHPGSRTTSYLHEGNKCSVIDFTGSVQTDHWYMINGIDVVAKKPAAAVAILGNSITDGRGSGTNKQNRWPDILSERLLKNKGTQNVGVLNLGIGGNCVLKNCLGPSGLDRFERDVINQHGVRWLIILEGINDLGQAPTSEVAAKVAKDLIAAYERMIDQAHAKGIRVYGATILPFNKSFYYTDYREAARNTVNEWVRTSGRFDAVIDFDKAMRDPQDTLTILPDVHTGDFLHPNEAGYQLMGESIDLKLFK